jgi:hypothetical protein
MIQVTEASGPPPADEDLSLHFHALANCTLPIRPGETIELLTGNCLALNDSALAESPLLHGAVLALVSCGALEPMRQGRLN